MMADLLLSPTRLRLDAENYRSLFHGWSQGAAMRSIKPSPPKLAFFSTQLCHGYGQRRRWQDGNLSPAPGRGWTCRVSAPLSTASPWWVLAVDDVRQEVLVHALACFLAVNVGSGNHLVHRYHRPRIEDYPDEGS